MNRALLALVAIATLTCTAIPAHAQYYGDYGRDSRINQSDRGYRRYDQNSRREVQRNDSRYDRRPQSGRRYFFRGERNDRR